VRSGKTFDPPKHRRRPAGEVAGQITRNSAIIQGSPDMREREQRLDLGCEGEARARAMDVERTHPHDITPAYQHPTGRVPHDEREVADYAVRAVGSPTLVCREEERCVIRRGVERQPERAKKVPAVVHTRISDEHASGWAVRRRCLGTGPYARGLIAELAQLEGLGSPDPPRSAAMAERREHAVNASRGHGRSIEMDDTSDRAHCSSRGV
jgi:hypothetical protein